MQKPDAFTLFNCRLHLAPTIGAYCGQNEPYWIILWYFLSVHFSTHFYFSFSCINYWHPHTPPFCLGKSDSGDQRCRHFNGRYDLVNAASPPLIPPWRCSSFLCVDRFWLQCKDRFEWTHLTQANPVLKEKPIPCSPFNGDLSFYKRYVPRARTADWTAPKIQWAIINTNVTSTE